MPETTNSTNMATVQTSSMPAYLEDVRIKDLSPSVFYISNFISEEEERILLNKVRSSPPLLSIADSEFKRLRRHPKPDGSSFRNGACKLGLQIS